MLKTRKFVIPYLVWLFAFIILPIFVMVFFAISNIQIFNLINFKLSSYSFSFSHFLDLFKTSFLLPVLRSFLFSLVSTFFSLLLAYPIAYFISNIKSKYKYLLLLLFIVPMWSNMVLRVSTINSLFKDHSFLANVFGFSFGFLGQSISFKIIFTMTVIYLPFMILPIYTTLEKLDKSLLEASSDLGANSYKTFLTITLPLSKKGIYSGILMTFLPSMMSYAIPSIVSDGNRNYVFIGELMERYFLGSSPSYNFGSLISIIMTLITLGAVYFLSKFDPEGDLLV